MIKLRKISMVLCIITMLFAVMSLSGCSNNSITGIWAFVDDDGQVSENSKMYFNDDGFAMILIIMVRQVLTLCHTRS